MCNFYLMYYTENDGRLLTEANCWEDAPSAVHFPPLPRLPPSHGPAHHDHPDHSPMGSEGDLEIIESVDDAITSPDDDTTSSIPPGVGEDDYICPSPVPPGPVPSQCQQNGNENDGMKNGNNRMENGDEDLKSGNGKEDLEDVVSWDIDLAGDWPFNGVDYPQVDSDTGMGGALGQVTSVAVTKDGSVFVLHRGPRAWEPR